MQTLPESQKDIQDITSLPEQQQVKGLLRAFLALRHRNFRLFWFGQMISLMGTWMQTIGQAWLVLQLTHSAWLLGIVGALQFLPVMLLSLFGGVLADRLPKRTVLLFTQSFAMLQAAVLWTLVATGEVRLWHVLVLATLLGLTNAIDMPTRQAFVVEMVVPLFATNVLNAVADGFGFISSAFGLGSLLSVLWLAWSNRKPGIQYLLVSAIVFCVVTALFAASHIYVLSLVLIAMVGFAMIAFSATANTTVQTVAPDHLRGRVMSVYMLVFAGSIPFGNLLTGGLAHLYGAQVALLIGVGISLVAAVTGWVLRKPAERDLAETSNVNE